ncbi:hypothetical protein PP175_26850 (plasmid) [Aneurinibacillus sp. Ricciae_BoGa-3]|uniref:hypothetical protein n=1 Tax=Aneurinibacillus sp. Ricciae_BoGa-3 TaxID=3022697 RepID=UPI0023406F40|nr:hypothetical protein [Aneurinibacillus sp. Ricciae_BoGa-3]WCK57657.1 hypothetical protein PP175_26850 [Aneurinibacillus sp. Ricciae_BoGa-3]
MEKNISFIRKEFFEWVRLLVDTKLMKSDTVSMGNLALFIDYFYPRKVWSEHKKTVWNWIKERDKNKLYLFLSEHLVDIARKQGLSNNLNFKINKIRMAYNRKSIRYFDIVLDSYEFPEWFQPIQKYHELSSKEEVFHKLSEKLNKRLDMAFLVKNEEKLNVVYFIDRFYGHPEYLPVFTELDEKLENDTVNEICYYIATNIFRPYYPELTKAGLVEEQKMALKKMKEYKKRYLNSQLQTIDLLSKRAKNDMRMAKEGQTH